MYIINYQKKNMQQSRKVFRSRKPIHVNNVHQPMINQNTSRPFTVSPYLIHSDFRTKILFYLSKIFTLRNTSLYHLDRLTHPFTSLNILIGCILLNRYLSVKKIYKKDLFIFLISTCILATKHMEDVSYVAEEIFRENKALVYIESKILHTLEYNIECEEYEVDDLVNKINMFYNQVQYEG